MNTICLDNLPRTSRGIDWKKSEGMDVSFEYRGISGIIKILKSIDADKVLVEYSQQTYQINKMSFINGRLGLIFGFAVKDNYRFDIGHQLDHIVVLERIRQLRKNHTTVKAYKLYCNICHNEFECAEANLLRGDRCPVCSSHKIVKGVNDIWTTNPEVGRLLTNPDDGYRFMAFSNQKVSFTCPTCQTHLGNKMICDVTAQGLSCRKCSDGISFPNKFIYAILSQLDIDFDTEVRFDWCVFPKYNSSDMTYGIYDVVIPHHKCIVEMDGGLGHGNNMFANRFDMADELIYRDSQKDALAFQHGYQVIRINCNYKGHENCFEICKTAILKSDLSTMFDLSQINWDEVSIVCASNFVKRSYELRQQGFTLLEISKILKKAPCTISDYLHKARQFSIH